MKKPIIVTHSSPDPDAVASAFFLKKVFNGEVFLKGSNEVTEKMLKFLNQKPLKKLPEKIKTLVVVDTNSIEEIKDVIEKAEEKILVDHHSPKKEVIKEFDKVIIDHTRTSCSEIVFEKYKEKVDRKTATVLAYGVFTDSVGLKIANSKTLKTLSEMLEKAGKTMYEVINLFSVKPPESQKIALLKAMQRLEFKRVKGRIIAWTRVSAYESSVAQLLMIPADVVLVENKREKRIEGRIKMDLSEKIHLGKLFEKIAKKHSGDGGGHAGAAGMKVKETQKVLKEVIKELERLL